MSNERGMTLVEVVLVVALMVPILSVVVSSTTVSTRTLHADDVTATAMEGLRRTTQRLAQFLRPCVLSTYKVAATQADVNAGRGSDVGEWIDPEDLEERTAVRFCCAESELNMNAKALTPPRVIQFVRDAKELANGKDDDGDGAIDEGRIQLIYDGTPADLAHDVEQCTFALDGRLLRVNLRLAIRRKDGLVARGATTHVMSLRNN